MYSESSVEMQIARYEFKEKLGEGTYGEVYLAYDSETKEVLF